MILPEPITQRVSQSEVGSGLQPGGRDPRGIRGDILGDTREHLTGYIKL
jgi:hypothetical protein